MQIDLQKINERKQKLEDTKVALKLHFIGIDKIIDELMDYIQVWYLMPELLTRPVILNLWGMTGVGKTDLIRRMVKQLDFTDRFTEIELSNIDNTSYITSVSAILTNNDLNDDKPSVVLFDEIQRFNTIDDEGRPLPQSKFTDFWELLSDGKLSKKQKDNIDYYIANFMFNEREVKKRKNKGEENVDENLDVNQWEYSEIRKILGSDLDPENKEGINQKQMLEMMLKAKTKKQIYEPVDHSKTLIIISGNLDEAFSVATQTSESDVDADIFYNNTTKVNLVDIKNALSRKFRPEQVARFGNIHLIYTSLRRIDFENLIKKEIERIAHNIKINFDIHVKIDDSIHDLIYCNGVFPVQGVRPVFSSIIDILESNLSKFLFEAILGNKKTISISYSKAKSCILCKIDDKAISVPFVGKMDKIRQSNIEDTVANISVHESGHAVVYMLLFGLAPLQLKSKIASSYAGGFTFPHTIHKTKENIIKEIKVLLAGGIAEEIVFGVQNASIGRNNDRERVTSLAIDYVRRYGFDDEFHANYMLDLSYSLDKTATDIDVEKMITRLVAETNQLLSQHKNMLLEISRMLTVNGSMESLEVADIGRKFGIKADTKGEDYLEIHSYSKDL
jgi:Peptidase family M41/ATPase family associated with various cellular activities (AAA)